MDPLFPAHCVIRQQQVTNYWRMHFRSFLGLNGAAPDRAFFPDSVSISLLEDHSFEYMSSTLKVVQYGCGRRR